MCFHARDSYVCRCSALLRSCSITMEIALVIVMENDLVNLNVLCRLSALVHHPVLSSCTQVLESAVPLGSQMVSFIKPSVQGHCEEVGVRTLFDWR